MSDCIHKFIPIQDQDDFKQELFVILLEKDHALIRRLHDNNELIFYTVRIIINLRSQKKNVYHKKYKQHVEELDHDPAELPEEEGDRIHQEALELRMVEEVSRLDEKFGTFFYRELVEAVNRHGSMREASAKTGIPLSTISRAIKKVREHLKTIK